MQKTLTDVTLASLPEGEYWDAKLPSFGVRVGKRFKTFLLNQSGRRVKIGRYPSVSLADARRRAFALKADPETAAQVTFSEALRLFYDTHCQNYRPKVLYETKRYLVKYAAYDNQKLAKISTQHVYQIIDQQTRAEANKLFTVSRTFFRFCVSRRFITKSPLEGLHVPNKETARARILTDDELRAVWKAADQCGQFGVIVKLLVLTGQRRGEIAALQTSWITHTPHTSNIVFPANVTKNGREHHLPVSSTTAQLALSVKGWGGWSKSKAALDELSGVTDWTLHDLRRTYRSNLARIGVAPHIAERLVNHVSARSEVDKIYDRYTYAKEMREAVERYETFLKDLF